MAQKKKIIQTVLLTRQVYCCCCGCDVAAAAAAAAAVKIKLSVLFSCLAAASEGEFMVHTWCPTTTTSSFCRLCMGAYLCEQPACAEFSSCDICRLCQK